MQEKQEKKVKVLFGENKIIDGTMYGKGVIDLSPEKAIVCVNHGGVVSSEDKQFLANYAEAQGMEGAPLSLEETMERFDGGDFSDEVLRSLQYHQAAIMEIKNAGKPPAFYGDVSKNKETSFEVGGESGKEDLTGSGNQTGNQTGGASSGNQTGNASGATGGANASGGSDSEEGEPANDLPAGLPYRKELLANGIVSLAKLKAMKKAEVLDLKDIAEGKANKIGAWLAAN